MSYDPVSRILRVKPIGESLFTVFGLISISNSVSDGATKNSFLNIERS